MTYSKAGYVISGPTRPLGAFPAGRVARNGARNALRLMVRPLLLCAAIGLLIGTAKAADLSDWSAGDFNLSQGRNPWTGGYAGAEVGVSQTANEATSGGSKKEFDRMDAAFGLFAGYNWQVSRVILGVEGAATYLGSLDTATHVTLGTIKGGSRWSASVKGRVGLPIGRVMPYLSAGLAMTDYTFKANGATQNSIGIGPVLGAGLDVAVTDRLRLRADYSLTGIIDDTASFNGTRVKQEAGNHRLMLGLSYGF